jgi:hypothetical protein
MNFLKVERVETSLYFGQAFSQGKWQNNSPLNLFRNNFGAHEGQPKR